MEEQTQVKMGFYTTRQMQQTVRFLTFLSQILEDKRKTISAFVNDSLASWVHGSAECLLANYPKEISDRDKQRLHNILETYSRKSTKEESKN